MAKWVPLKEVLMHPEKYGKISQRKIAYIPDYSTIKLNEMQTGVNAPQTFETEMNYTWYATLHKGKVYLTTREVTAQALKLRGEIGFKNANEVQNKISRLYEDEDLGTKAEIWNEDTIDMAIRILPGFLRYINDIYWTAIKYEHRFRSGYCYFGLQLVYSSTLCGNGEGNYYGLLYRSNNSSYMSAASVRPLVSVPENVLVDVEGIESDIPLKLKTFDDNK